MRHRRITGNGLFDALLVVLVLVFFAALIIAVGVLLPAWLLVAAWGAVAVPVFGWKQITFTQALWILVALWVIGGFFKSSGGGKE